MAFGKEVRVAVVAPRPVKNLYPLLLTPTVHVLDVKSSTPDRIQGIDDYVDPVWPNNCFDLDHL